MTGMFLGVSCEKINLMTINLCDDHSLNKGILTWKTIFWNIMTVQKSGQKWHVILHENKWCLQS